MSKLHYLCFEQNCVINENQEIDAERFRTSGTYHRFSDRRKPLFSYALPRHTAQSRGLECASQVPLNAAGSQVGPRNTPGKRFFTADDAYALKTVNEDFVFEQEGFRFIKGFGRFIAEDEHFLEHFIGNITCLSADAGIRGSEARPSELFVKIMDFFTFLITVQENGHGAYVHAVHADRKSVV